MSPQDAAAAARADYTQNSGAYNSTAPTLGVTPSTYSYVPDNSGGFNYYQNGSTPITREAYTAGSGNQAPGDGSGAVLGDSTSTTAQPTAQDLQNAATARYQAGVKASVDLQHQGALGNADTLIGQYGAGDYNTGINDLIASKQAGQNVLDANATNNELSRMQGHQGILDMVGNGIRSGGVMLANKNASDSSASEALARAYGLLGRQQESKVGNQYEQGVNKDEAAQHAFDAQETGAFNDFTTKKNDTINGIINQTQATLQTLNSSLAGANLSDRIDIQNEIANTKAKAANLLQQYDAHLASGMGGITASSAGANRQKATTLNAAGTASPDQFDYTAQAPLTQQGTGPQASSLPLFSLPKSKQTA